MHSLNKRIRFIYLFVGIVVVSLSFLWVFKLNPDLVPRNLIDIRLCLSTYIFWGIALIFSLHNAQLYYTDRYISILREWLRDNPDLFVP